MTLAIIMAGIALFIAGATFVIVLVLLGRKDFQYATKRELEQLGQELLARQAVLGRNQSKLFRYLEALDEHSGANGHRVLGTSVPDKTP